jgi:hypothetical protein
MFWLMQSLVICDHYVCLCQMHFAWSESVLLVVVVVVHIQGDIMAVIMHLDFNCWSRPHQARNTPPRINLSPPGCYFTPYP